MARHALHLVGCVLSPQDGHTRLTRGPGFHIAGGTADAHDRMVTLAQEAAKEAAQAGNIRDAMRAVRAVLNREAQKARR